MVGYTKIGAEVSCAETETHQMVNNNTIILKLFIIKCVSMNKFTLLVSVVTRNCFKVHNENAEYIE